MNGVVRIRHMDLVLETDFVFVSLSERHKISWVYSAAESDVSSSLFIHCVVAREGTPTNSTLLTNFLQLHVLFFPFKLTTRYSRHPFTNRTQPGRARLRWMSLATRVTAFTRTRTGHLA